MYKLWNADSGKFWMNGLRMCRRTACRLADKLEAETGDQFVMMPA